MKPCDALCIRFYGGVLHSWDCQIKNRRDPILKDRVINDYAMDPRD